jgi:hypothetical protein
MVQYFSSILVTTNVTVCTYWWWFDVTGEREIEHDEIVERDCTVQFAVGNKTQNYSNTRRSLTTCMDKSGEVQGH